MSLITPDAPPRARVFHHPRAWTTPNHRISHRPRAPLPRAHTPRVRRIHAHTSRASRAPPSRPPARAASSSSFASSVASSSNRARGRTSSRNLDRRGAVHATEGALRGDERGGHRRAGQWRDVTRCPADEVGRGRGSGKCDVTLFTHTWPPKTHMSERMPCWFYLSRPLRVDVALVVVEFDVEVCVRR